MPRRKPRPPADPAADALLRTLNPHAAGIDLGAREHWACAPEGALPAPQPRARRFGACTADLRALAAWLRGAGVDTVALEATGVYWVPVYDLLEAEGFRVLLADPHQARAVPGRPKTDVPDCMWLQRLHSLGLLSAAFRPEGPVRAWRSYQRHRASLVEGAARLALRMRKALEQMNVKLAEVLSDVTGATGLAIVKAILAGQRDPARLAALRRRGCKQDEAGIARALEGTWQPEHLLALRQALALYEYYRQQIAECDGAIEAHLRGLARPEPPAPLPPRPRPRRRRGNAPHFDARQRLYELAGVDLTAIEGVEEGTAAAVLSAVGTDMGRWRSERAFGAWLGLAPNPKKTGGKVRSAATRAGANRAARALRLAARSLQRSQSALGAFFRRIAARRGVPKAITATAYKLARIVYGMLKHGQGYVARGLAEYEAEHRERQVRQLRRRAKELGYELTAAAAEGADGALA